MSTIKIQQGDWLKNAAIVGFIKVIEKLMSNIDDINYENDYIEFDSKLLDGFEEAYFKVLIKENRNNLSINQLIKSIDIIEKLSIKDFTEKDLKNLNEMIDNFKSKLTSNSYKNGFLLLEDNEKILKLEKGLKKIKLKKKEKIEDSLDIIEEQIDLIKEIVEYLNRKDVKRIIEAKNVIYSVIQPFWTNVSFLLKTNNKNDMYKLYRDDFIKPVKNYIDKDNIKFKYNCFTCGNKISKLNKPDAFDLTWLVKTGVDMSRKSSHFWNFNGDAYICPICNLVYSCLPLGFAMIKGKGLFINNNQTIELLKQSNITKIRDENKSFEEIEQLSYLNIVNSMEQYNIDNLDKEFENIQIVKIDSNNDRRTYSFNVLSPELMKIIYFNRKRLNSLIKIRVKITEKYYINLYDEVVKRLYDGKNLFKLISDLLYMNLNGSFKGINFIYKILQINNFITGGKKMNLDDIKRFSCYGLNLREKYVSKDNEGKLSGITYRLLNALKTKDSAKFMETLINAYMYMRLRIPSEFSKALNNEELLLNIGYAFLIGLQGEKENKEDNREENKQND